MGKVSIYRLLFVCVFVFCVFVRLRIAPPRRQILHGGSSASKAGNLPFM